jgi:hypothetical protein
MTILDGDIDAFARGPAAVDRHRGRVPVVVNAAGSGPPAGRDDGELVAVVEKRLPR